MQAASAGADTGEADTQVQGHALKEVGVVSEAAGRGTLVTLEVLLELVWACIHPDRVHCMHVRPCQCRLQAVGQAVHCLVAGRPAQGGCDARHMGHWWWRSARLWPDREAGMRRGEMPFDGCRVEIDLTWRIRTSASIAEPQCMQQVALV